MVKRGRAHLYTAVICIEGCIGACMAGCAVDDRVVSSNDPISNDPMTMNGEMPAPNPPAAMGGSGNATAPALNPEQPPGSELENEGTPVDTPISNGNPDGGGAPDPMLPVVPPDMTPPDMTPPEEPSPAVSVTFGGDGFGRVTLSAPGFNAQLCDDDCDASFPVGTLVTLSSTARAYSEFRGWSAPGCGTQPSCSVAVTSDVALRANFQLGYNVAFVSTQIYSVDQLPAPGVAANSECARLAGAAGLHGTRYVAWLAGEGPSTALTDDITPAQFLQNTGGWVRTDGVPLARNRAALLANQLLNPLDRDELGAKPLDFASWSGVTVGGLLYRTDRALDCDNWTDPEGGLGGIALTSSVGFNWSGSSGRGCGSTAYMQCFGDDPAPEVPLPPLPAGARLAFASTTRFDPADGIGSADTICQEDACAAGLTGSANCANNLGTQRRFLAYLHSSVQRAFDRFDLSRPNWFRVDGFQWLPATSNLAQDGAGSLTGIDIRADGSFADDNTLLWTGRVSGADTCADWSSNTAIGGFGLTTDVGFALNGATRQGFTCNTLAKVVCLEQ